MNTQWFYKQSLWFKQLLSLFTLSFLLLATLNLSVVKLHYCRDGDKMVPSVEKKIAELEMGLLHLQQNIDIPEISLAIHPVVTAMVKKCAEDGRRPKVQDFGDKVEDSTFLNQLQNGVNRWIREIQKVRNVKQCCTKSTEFLVAVWLSNSNPGFHWIWIVIRHPNKSYEERWITHWMRQVYHRVTP